MTKIPFNKPFLTGAELANIACAHDGGQLAGDGRFTRECRTWFEERFISSQALLTTSCTAALEMAALLCDIEPGDEVIMPSFTFVSTANAFVLRGAIPVFIDIRVDTLNIDENLIEAAITSRTKAIVVVHYAGVSCEMERIVNVARRYGISVVEDAAQALMSKYNGRLVGSKGRFGCFSFHETKNIISGEGGLLLVNDPRDIERAEIIREKGTDRSKFFRGQVDKYTWSDIGSSYLPGEIIAAFLAAQLLDAEGITNRRRAIWNDYHAGFERVESEGLIRRPMVPPECEHNGHMYYLVLRDLETRTEFIQRMSASGVQVVFHYVPLHSSPYGKKAGRCHGRLEVTESLSSRLVRLPMWLGVERYVASIVEKAVRCLY